MKKYQMFKKVIGITHKIMEHPKYDETLDCIDLKWGELLTKINFMPLTLSTVDSKLVSYQLEKFSLNGVILSGGDTPHQYLEKIEDNHRKGENNNLIFRDLYELKLIEECIKRKIPILGVCRGFQLLNIYFGGNIEPIENHAGKKKHVIESSSDNIFFDFPRKVNSYHNYCISKDSLGSELIPLAYDIDGNIEAAKHKTNNILGIMWHPEREEPFEELNLRVLDRFFQ